MADKNPAEKRQEDLALYALGALESDEAERLTDTLNADGDSDTQSELRDLEQVAALLGHAAPSLSPPPHLKARLFDRIQPEPPLSRPPMTPATPPLDFNSLDWQPSEWPGVDLHWLRLDEQTGSGAVYFKIQPGESAPSHRHQGAEDCLILQGGFRDARGEYRAGDLVYYEPGSIHEDFQALEGDPCILFVVYQQGGIEVIAE